MNHKTLIDYGIIGLGRFGFALTKTLSAAGKEVIAIDTAENRVKLVRHMTDNAFLVPSFDKETLRDIGIQNCAAVIICIGDSIDVSVLTTLNIISMGIPRVISRAGTYEQGLVLEKIGAEVIYPENDMAVRLANRLINTNIMETIELRGGIAISELKLTEKIAGQTILQSNLRQKYNLTVIALEHEGETCTDITPDLILNENDDMVVVGTRENIKRLEAFLTGQR